jgi:gliding motility-associated-like protein
VVNAQPVLAPTFTQSTCSNTTNAVNLGLSFNGTPNGYSVTWNPTPASVTSNTQTAAQNLNAGATNVTVTATGGCSATTSFAMNSVVVPTMTLTNVTGSYSLTCNTPSITMAASSSYTNGSLNYFWSSLTFTANTPTVNIVQTGTYNVCATDPVTSCSVCQTFTINQNLVAPTSSVDPVNQVITCGSSLATFTGVALSTTVNIVHEWYCPQAPPPIGPPSFTNGNVVSPFSTNCGPGTYTYIIRDITNGCTVTKTVSINSVSGFPSFQTTSSTNYSVGCTPLNQTTLNIVNAQTTSSAAAQFLFLPPGTPSAVPVPTNVFIGNPSTITAIPGAWTVVVQDPNNGCQTALPVNILQNTIAPHAAANFAPATQTLTCYNPTILATGSSSTQGSTVSWQVPSTPPVIPSPTIILGTPTGPPTHSTNFSYATYTLIVTNTVNACVTTQTVLVNQNFRVPTPSISAVSNPTSINCTGVPVQISYTNNAAQSLIPAAVATVVSWAGPAPQVSVTTGAQYPATVPGIYTLTVQDNKNGCINTATRTIIDNTQPPVLSPVTNTAILDCAANSATLIANVVGGNTNHKFWYRNYPVGTAFFPGNATTPPLGTSSGTVLVDLPGYYNYVVTNTITGCKTTGEFSVIVGGLTASFTAEPEVGFAPLLVNFTNLSSTSVSSASITTLWSFGNGSSFTSSTGINPATTYTAPGTYTVLLAASKGACFDTTFKVIKVEIPSKLEVPNVFTPNDDGSNDVFFLKVQNITEITALIYDRWGNKVYDVTSETGNIAWDGKSLNGKICPPGTYFYIIKGKGKDGQEYEQKGNVSLYR